MTSSEFRKWSMWGFAGGALASAVSFIAFGWFRLGEKWPPSYSYWLRTTAVAAFILWLVIMAGYCGWQMYRRNRLGD
jgi:hypothetical protein